MKKQHWLILLSICMVTILLQGCSNKDTDFKNQNGKIKVVEFADYKCPYCKKVEDDIMPKLTKDYIDKDKVEYQFINVAFLGKDSIIGSRAGHAVKNIAPKAYLDFQKKIYAKQPNTENHKKPWINEKVLDDIIDSLNISDAKKAEIKKDYKTKDSQSQKDAAADQKLAKKKKIDTVPVVYIDGKKVKDPYTWTDYEKLLKQ